MIDAVDEQASGERKRLDFFTQWKAGRSRMDHEQSVETKVGECCGGRVVLPHWRGPSSATTGLAA